MCDYRVSEGPLGARDQRVKREDSESLEAKGRLEDRERQEMKYVSSFVPQNIFSGEKA